MGKHESQAAPEPQPTADTTDQPTAGTETTSTGPASGGVGGTVPNPYHSPHTTPPSGTA